MNFATERYIFRAESVPGSGMQLEVCIGLNWVKKASMKKCKNT